MSQPTSGSRRAAERVADAAPSGRRSRGGRVYFTLGWAWTLTAWVEGLEHPTPTLHPRVTIVAAR